MHRIAIATALLLVACADQGQHGPAFLAGAQQHLAAREYWASETRDGLQAPNRRHDLRTFFEPTGVRVHGRGDAAAAPLLELRLAGVGRGDVLAPLAPGELSQREGRVEIRRAGVVEWFENSASGLEQGFTLAERPDGRGALVLELSVRGARADLRGDRVTLASASGRELSYEKLAVADASGRALSARFEVPDASRVRLLVDDAGAAYPVVVDPLLAGTPDAQLSGDQAGVELGTGVASAGDVNGDGFDDVIVTAPFYDLGEFNEGAAFLFFGSPSGIGNGSPATADAVIQGDQPIGNMALAVGALTVASLGDFDGDGYGDVLVGFPYYDAGEVDEGAAFVFRGSATGFTGTNPATASARFESNQPSAQMGWSVAAGDVNGDGRTDAIVGARLYDAGETEEGAAFVFHAGASGFANGSPDTADASFEPDQPSANAGTAVAAGDFDDDGYADLAVGAPRYDDGQADEGAVFVFRGSPAGITGNGHPGSEAVRIGGDLADAQLGGSVAAAGDVNGDGYTDLIVGAAFYSAPETREGAAFVFHGSAGGIAGTGPATARTILQSNQQSAGLGDSVASAGDVNADGFADVIVGAPATGTLLQGAAYVFTGGPLGIASGDPNGAYARFTTTQTIAFLGSSVASAGDVNGDGSSDVVVGAPLFDAGDTNTGAAFVYLPEPGAATLLGCGGALLALLRRHRGR